MPLCASVYLCLVVTCWERADLLALVCGVLLWVFHFPIGILPGSGVVLDCIDSWSLQPYLLCAVIQNNLTSNLNLLTTILWKKNPKCQYNNDVLWIKRTFRNTTAKKVSSIKYELNINHKITMFYKMYHGITIVYFSYIIPPKNRANVSFNLHNPKILRASLFSRCSKIL